MHLYNINLINEWNTVTKKNEENILHLERHNKKINNLYRTSLNYQMAQGSYLKDWRRILQYLASAVSQSYSDDIQPYNTIPIEKLLLALRLKKKKERWKRQWQSREYKRNVMLNLTKYHLQVSILLNIWKTVFVPTHMTIFKMHFEF